MAFAPASWAAAPTRPEGVLLLHGLGLSGRSMWAMKARLQAAGYHTLAPSYPSRHASMPEIVDHLLPAAQAFAQGFDGPLHIVSHSLGGLVARALVAARRPAPLGRVVMLAPPNAGSELADLLLRLRMDRFVLGPIAGQLCTQRSGDEEALLGPVDFDLGIIAGNRALTPLFTQHILPQPHDGKVSVTATRLAGMRDHIVLPIPHTLMTTSRAVAHQVLAYLQAGRFQRP